MDSGPYTASNRLNFQNADYSYWESPGADLYPQQSATAKNPVPLGDGWALCWKRQEGDRAPGLYRASGLTVEEINALPTDGEAYGQEVLCNSTEFGTLEAFYCLADAEVALAGASMAGGIPCCSTWMPRIPCGPTWWTRTANAPTTGK